MKIGDIVTTIHGFRFLIYDMSDYKNYLYVTDPERQILNDYIAADEVISVEEKPSNVEYLFLKRREKNLKEMGSYQ